MIDLNSISTTDASAVRSSVIAARQMGLELLASMGEVPKCLGTPYL